MTDTAFLLDEAVERGKQRSLRRHKQFATGLLVVAAVTYGLTYLVTDPSYGLHLLRAGAEAGIIGGLADWFAVTALFRHPLGIPIPHTALVPMNKNRIGANLGQFIERHFLAPDEVVRKLRSLNAGASFGGWLKQETNARVITDYFFAALPHILHSLDDRQIRSLLRDIATDRLSEVPLAPVLGEGLALLTRQGQHRALLDRLLVAIKGTLKDNEDHVHDLVVEKSRWWIPESVDHKIAASIIEGIQDLLTDLTADEHPLRLEFEQATEEWISKLSTEPETIERFDQLRDKLLHDPEIQDLMGSIWDRLQTYMMDQARSPAPELHTMVTSGLVTFGERLENDHKLAARLDQRIEEFVLGVAVPWRAEIGKFITDVVERWDTDTISNRIELEIGPDLQFVRVNGTLVGSLVGCIVFVVTDSLLI